MLKFLLGLILLPVLPFLSAKVWGAPRKLWLATLVLALAGYAVFFTLAMIWGVALVFLAALVALVGGIAGWRLRRTTVT